MILSNKQAARFTKLFNLLMDYVSVRFDDEHGNTNLPSDQELAEALLSSVWGKDGDVSIIDDFIEENPARINPTDQRTVLAWKNAVFDYYSVLIDGNDTYFLYGGHAFAVRGITREIIDQVDFIPAIVRTVLIPFDGLITYGTLLFTMRVDIGPNMRKHMEEDLASYKADGKTIRTERQYERLFPVARAKAEEDAKASAEDEELFAYDPDNDPLAEGQHEGVLAGLTWDEREKAIEDNLEEQLNEMRRALEEETSTFCEDGEPADTLSEHFSRYTRAELIEHAKTFGIEGPLSKQRKADLVDTICAYHLAHPEDGIDLARYYGLSEIRFLSRLVEANGRLIVKKEDAQSPFDLPVPIIPFMAAYQDGQDFVVSMPKDLLSSFSDVDFDAVVKQTERMERDLDILFFQVEFWGVMTESDVVDFLNNHGYDEQVDEGYRLLNTMVHRIYEDPTSCERVKDDRTGRAYIVEADLFDELDVDEDNILYDDTPILDILDQREGKPKRLVDDLELYPDIADYMQEKDSYRELCAFLDAHIPDGESDYYFAEEFADNVVYESRLVYSPTQVFEIIDDMYMPLTEPQMSRLTELMTAVINDTPHWTNYGWSPNELRELRRSRT